MQQPVEKLNQLTFTRFLAALSVLFYHSGRGVGILTYLPFLTSGQTAVSYFFVLSGFVMAYVYYRPEKKFNYQEYWLARFSRIYPVYIISFIVVCLYFLKLMGKTESDSIFANIFLYQAWFSEYAQSFNMAAWSLSVEIFFYVLVPILVFWSLKQPVKKIIWVSLGFWITSQFLHSILYTSFNYVRPNFFLAFFPPFHLNAFLIGFAGGVWYLNKSTTQKTSTFWNLFFLVLSIVLVWVGLYMRDVTGTFGKTFYVDVGLFSPFFLVTILTLASDKTFISKWFSHPWLVLLGEASYAMYILHVPIRWWLQRIIENLSISLSIEWFLIIYVPLTLIICILSYLYIEVPSRDWIRKNKGKLLTIVRDVVVMAILIKLAFFIRLGFDDFAFMRTQRFTIFFGTIIFFSLLLLTKFYSFETWYKLATTSFLGSISLTLLVYYAWQNEWIEGFPRPILAMIPVFIFCSIYFLNFKLKTVPANVISNQ